MRITTASTYHLLFKVFKDVTHAVIDIVCALEADAPGHRHHIRFPTQPCSKGIFRHSLRYSQEISLLSLIREEKTWTSRANVLGGGGGGGTPGSKGGRKGPEEGRGRGEKGGGRRDEGGGIRREEG